VARSVDLARLVKNGLTIKRDGLAKMVAGLNMLARNRVMVGIPEDKNGRQAEDEEHSPLGNATLGYIHEHGAPEVNIPARPWLAPGVKSVEASVIEPGLRRAAELALEGKPESVMRVYEVMGMRTASAVKAYITAGIDPPLADSTLKARARRGRKGAKQELANRAAGKPASTDLAKPLIDTSQLRNSVTYIIRGWDKK
jgi:hypothetical protein